NVRAGVARTGGLYGHCASSLVSLSKRPDQAPSLPRSLRLKNSNNMASQLCFGGKDLKAGKRALREGRT
ncbi:hypothetical protein Ancab_039192, partial [Ancistrocladus abbreviatus]